MLWTTRQTQEKVDENADDTGKVFGKFKSTMTHGPGSEHSCVSITHTHTHVQPHRHAHRGCIRGTVRESHGLRPVSRSITCQKGPASPWELVTAVNAAATVYSLLTVCRVSQLVLHNHDLILFFQQPHLVKFQYHFTDKKTEVCFITRLPPWKRQQGHLYPHHTCFLRARFPMSVGIKFGFILDLVIYSKEFMIET